MFKLAAVGFRHGHNWGLVKGLLETGEVRLVAVVEDHPELAAQAAEKYHVPVFATIGELLEKVEVDIASLAPVNRLKADFVCALARGGVHCLVDKPLTTTEEGRRRIEEAVRAAGVVCVTALPVRFFPAHWTARRLIREGRIGRVAAVFAHRSHNLHPHTRRPWELSVEENGGTLVDLGNHDWDYVAWCLESPPVTVSASETLMRYTDLTSFADSAQMFVRFGDGATATVWSDWLAPDGVEGSATGVLFVGTRATLRIDEHQGTLTILAEGGGWRAIEPDPRRPDLYRDFLAAVRGRPHVVTIDQTLAVSRLLLAAHHAARTGEVVHLG